MAKEGDPWIEASDVIPMFPTVVWKIQLNATFRDATNAKVLATLEGVRLGLPQLRIGQGWQSNQTLHEREEFRDLIACVDNVAKSILRERGRADQR